MMMIKQQLFARHTVLGAIMFCLSFGMAYAQISVDGTKHIIQKGETLYSIAKKYGLSLSDLRQLNGLKNFRLDAGGVLNIKKSTSTTGSVPVSTAEPIPSASPSTSSTATAPAVPTTTGADKVMHTVKPGETLYSISRRYGLSVDKLKTMNNLPDNTVKLGQVLTIEGVNLETVARKSVQQRSVAASTINSRRTGGIVGVDDQSDPAATNPRRTGGIVGVDDQSDPAATNPRRTGGVVGVDDQQVAPPGSYIVKAGDTVFSIAQRHKLTPAALRRLNGLRNDRITVGQVLKVVTPAASASPSTSSEATPKPTAPARSATVARSTSLPGQTKAGKTHSINRGDTFYSIATSYNIAVADILAANPGTWAGKNLKPGEVIQLPATSGKYERKHVVQAGEGITEIANKYNVSANSIRVVNSTGNILKKGQVLRIPNKEQGISFASALKGTIQKGKAVIDTRANGTATNSGEKLDQDELTISHKNLPMNSVVLISNKSKNMHTFARVIDRTTSGANLALVSPKVAQEIGISGSGEIELRLVKNGK
ncbi:MAG: LysM peptidoglycan-binding domain-containing protein [Bacteroidetes Order II. Incertae sedis bacterium]|nr:LysM peptidoglycan-binding domain-containing protein [Bacteroidetes Order II. bacterium]